MLVTIVGMVGEILAHQVAPANVGTAKYAEESKQHAGSRWDARLDASNQVAIIREDFHSFSNLHFLPCESLPHVF
ncbi:MAG: hypothetical protein AAFP90_09325 [Planctomycetota bacterium]